MPWYYPINKCYHSFVNFINARIPRLKVKKVLPINIASQPDDTTCGPTSLHAIYDYYGDAIKLEKVIKDINQHAEGCLLYTSPSPRD